MRVKTHARMLGLSLASLLLAGTARAATLGRIAEAHYHDDRVDDPVGATLLGIHDGDPRLDDLSDAAGLRRA